MTTKFKYTTTTNNKAKVRNVVVLSMTETQIAGIDLAYLTKEEAKLCKKIAKVPGAEISAEAQAAMKPYMKAFRKFDVAKMIR